jgi:hypothetical protein
MAEPEDHEECWILTGLLRSFSKLISAIIYS